MMSFEAAQAGKGGPEQKPKLPMMRVSVIVPIYNEENTVRAVVQKILQSPAEVWEVVLVDDGSTDNTRSRVHSEVLGLDQRLRLLTHDRNRGKGAALRTALEHVQGDIVLIQDADLEYDPAEYPVLLKPILEDKADVVYGSRFVGGRPHRVVYFWHMIGNKFLTLLSNMMTDINLTDMESGFKVFRREILEQVRIEEDRFGFEPEITAKVARLKCRIYEVGISYYGRTYCEGKKITWRDGVRAIYCILKYNLRR